MDYKKIGEFIANERKSKKMTQAKLAEKIYVSEKTVSKWENGNGLPDTHLLPTLCSVLGVTLNEMLSGERVEESTAENNEQVLLNMAKEIECKNKTIMQAMWVILAVSIVSMMVGILLVAFFVPVEVWQVVLIAIICIGLLIPCFYALRLEISVGVYKCQKCGYEIVPTYMEALMSMHRGTTRYLKCPSCNKRTCCKKVIK